MKKQLRNLQWRRQSISEPPELNFTQVFYWFLIILLSPGLYLTALAIIIGITIFVAEAGVDIQISDPKSLGAAVVFFLFIIVYFCAIFLLGLAVISFLPSALGWLWLTSLLSMREHYGVYLLGGGICIGAAYGFLWSPAIPRAEVWEVSLTGALLGAISGFHIWKSLETPFGHCFLF